MSNVLAADTLLKGRFANPTPPFPEHFETLHVLVTPTYASKYPIGSAFFMALGKFIFGEYFWGVVFSISLCSVATMWAARAWTTPAWAFLAGLTTCLVFGTGSYWIRSGWGGGAILLGSLLCLGGYRWLTEFKSSYAAWMFALGLSVCFFSRPFEGALLGLTLAFALIWRLVCRSLPKRAILHVLCAGFLIGGATIWIQYRINLSVTGNPLVLPYQEYAKQYLDMPILWFLPPDTSPKSGGEALRQNNLWGNLFLSEIQALGPLRTVYRNIGLIKDLLDKTSISLSVLIAFSLFVGNGTSLKLLLFALPVYLGLLAETSYRPHYAAPLMACLLLLKFQLASRLTLFRRGASKAGVHLVFVWLIFSAILEVAGYLGVLVAAPYAPVQQKVKSQLSAIPGKHLVLVRRKPVFNHHLEPVYNAADLDSSDVVWARELAPNQNEQLINRFPGRKVWLCEADLVEDQKSPPYVRPYRQE